MDAFCASLTSKVNDGQNAFPWSCTRVSSGENLLLDYGQSNANSSARKGDYVSSYYDDCTELLSSTPGSYQVCAYARVYFDPDELDIRLSDPAYTPSRKERARRDVIHHGLFAGIGYGTDHSLSAGTNVLARELGGCCAGTPTFLNAAQVCQLRSWYILVQDGFFFTLSQGGC